MSLAALLTLAALHGAEPLPVVEDLALPRLAGEWHEIGSIPTFFTRGCYDAVTRYTPDGEDRFAVLTTCRDGSPQGPEDTSDGVLRVAEPGQPAKLEIGYVPFVWGDYWVIDRDDDYAWFVVGHPGRGYLWIYARAPRLDPALLGALYGRLEGLGYDPAQIRLRSGQSAPVARPPADTR